MRSISATAMAQVTQQLGGEPLVVLAVYWDGISPSFYCDRGAFIDVPQLQGKILELGNLEDVVNISNSTSSQSVKVKLDDTDGTIKNIYNFTDIHKKKVIIYQWFSQINFNEKFIIFEGTINSPITWSEKDRTFEFDIVSRLEDAEIGYSPEEGDYPSVSDNLLGKPWPLPFGTVYKIPGIQIDTVGNAVLMDSIGLHDPKLDADIFNLISKSVYITSIGFSLIIQGGYLMSFGISGADSSEIADLSGSADTNPRDQQAKSMVDAGNKLLAEANKMMQDATKISAQREREKETEKDSLVLFNGLTFPQNVTTTFEIGGLLITGSIHASSADSRGDSILSIESITTKILLKAHLIGGERAINQFTGQNFQLSAIQKIVDKGPGFVFEKAGTHLKWLGPLPIRWIAAMLPCTVLGVYAIRDYGGSKLMTAVPTNYYSVSFETYTSADGGPGVTATVITLERPLTYRNDIESGVSNGGGGGWEDQLYVDVISPVGPNTVSILQWMIETYSDLSWDTTSFSTVVSQLINFPMHFCLFDRKNLIQALQEIAFQARCAIYLKEDLFYLIYLVPEPAPIDTITLDDIIFGSLELHHTPTEQLVTKFTAEYKIYYGPQTGFAASDIGSKTDKIILRNNMRKYGLHEQTYNYYAFTSPYLVDLSATFWLIRKSNTWKQVTFKTPLHKMKLETFDAITINFSHDWACTGPMIGIVESATLNTDATEITFSVWIPVRLGEMTKYPFANPIDSTFFFYPTVKDEPGSNNVGETTGGDLQSNTSSNGATVSFSKGGRRRIHHGHPNPGTTGNDIIIYPVVQPSIGNLDTTVKPEVDNVDQEYDLDTEIDEALALNKSVPARITAVASAGRPRYSVEAYPKGPFHTAVDTVAIDMTDDDHEEELEEGTWVMISQLVYKVKDDSDVPHDKVIKVFVPPGGTGSSTFPGVVTGGSGDTYTCNVYTRGLTKPPESVSVKQLQISSDTVPNGTWALIAQGSKEVPPGEDSREFTMQVAVWVG